MFGLVILGASAGEDGVKPFGGVCQGSLVRALLGGVHVISFDETRHYSNPEIKLVLASVSPGFVKMGKVLITREQRNK
jgi:hypothetical protein